MTPLEKFCAPETTDAAKADPGSVGIEVPPPGAELGTDFGTPEGLAELAGLYPGS
jgi:hypothetical protein